MTVENPVHQNINDKWYFWDETWAFKRGPYNTEKEATKALNEYYSAILGESEDAK